MAREEALATLKGVKFLNMHLAKVVPNRSEEAIKGTRRKAKYKAMVIANIVDIRSPPSKSQEPDVISEQPMRSALINLQRPVVNEVGGEPESEGIRERILQLVDIIRQADRHTHQAAS